MILTLLSISRGILGGKPVDYSPLTEDGPTWFPDDLKRWLQEELDALGARNIASYLERSGFHWSTKIGPNGPALASSLLDYENLPDSLKEQIVTLEPRLRPVLTKLRQWKDDFPGLWSVLLKVHGGTLNKGILRRLSIRPDREAKSRIFAILDYWSQEALKPLHLLIFQLLKMFSTDCTFNQGNGTTLKAPASHSYHSFDLTSATDRFPVYLQEFVVGQIIGKERAAAWKEILTGYPYLAPSGESYLYKVGQPMGAHSSWPVFTLCHHLIIQYCSFRVGLPAPFKHYRLLGDDIVIAHDQVAAEYQKVMTSLGVSISPTKTHVSKDSFEMAKRWIHHAREITPCPISGLWEVRNKWHLLAELFKTTTERGFDYIGDARISQSMLHILQAAGYEGRFLYSRLRLIRCFLILRSFTSKTHTAEKVMGIEKFLRLFNTYVPCNWRDTTISNWFDKIASSCYIKMQEEAADRARSLVKGWQYRLLTELEEHADLGPGDQSELSDHWYESVPALGALSDKSKESHDSLISSIRLSQAPSHLVWDKLPSTKVLVLPLATGVIPIRSEHLQAGATAVMVRKIITKVYDQWDDHS